jgi:hypothetical protein
VIRADQTPAWLASLAIGLEGNTAVGASVSKSPWLLSFRPGQQKGLVQQGDRQRLTRMKI